MEELNWIVDRAIDEAFVHDKYLLNFYKYMENQGAKRKDAAIFLEKGSTIILDLISELEDYVAGGNKQLLEAYKHVGKTKARKIIKYLQKIIQDAKDYEYSKRPGRRKGSKNKKTIRNSNK